MNGLKRVLLIIALLAAAAFLSWEALKVRDIVVVGAVNRQSSEAVSFSGISLGDSLLTLDRDQVRDNINSSRYFIYEGVDIDWPSGIVLRVYERQPRAYIVYLNSMAVIDETGFVLEIRPAVPESDLVRVGGLRVSEYLAGRTLTCEIPEQLNVLTQVFAAISEQGMAGEFKEMYISQSLGIELVTAHNITVEMGTSISLPRKLLWVKTVVPQLLDMYGQDGVSGSSLDVSSGQSAVFRTKED